MTLLKNLFAQKFKIEDMGEHNISWKLKWSDRKKGIFISQRKYILDLLEEAGTLSCKTAKTPIMSNHKLQARTSTSINRERYQRLVRRLMYIRRLDWILYIKSAW